MHNKVDTEGGDFDVLMGKENNRGICILGSIGGT
jgi:hypothetical protein